MVIGVDTSGQFGVDLDNFEPAVLAAAIASEDTLDEIAVWAAEACARWNGDQGELHAKRMHAEERLRSAKCSRGEATSGSRRC
jgi:hypothetical protein